MKDVLIEYDGVYVDCELDGLTLTYTLSEEPKYHYVRTLRDEDAYERLKQDIHAYHHDENTEYDAIWYFLETERGDEYFLDEYRRMYIDLREREEIDKYLTEAEDKVWLMRARPGVFSDTEIERILNTYDDIPQNGSTDWACGYWNGIMGALRWVLGEEKNWLDT